MRRAGNWKNDHGESRAVRGVHFHVRRWFVREHESAAADERRGGDRGEVLFAADRERDRVRVHGEELAE